MHSSLVSIPLNVSFESETLESARNFGGFAERRSSLAFLVLYPRYNPISRQLLSIKKFLGMKRGRNGLHLDIASNEKSKRAHLSR